MPAFVGDDRVVRDGRVNGFSVFGILRDRALHRCDSMIFGCCCCCNLLLTSLIEVENRVGGGGRIELHLIGRGLELQDMCVTIEGTMMMMMCGLITRAN